MRSAKSTSYGYPIVDPIEMYCTLQYGRFRHPKLPGLRSKVCRTFPRAAGTRCKDGSECAIYFAFGFAQVTIPGLSFHLSPARLARTMKLICNLTGLGQGQAGKEPAWLQEVDYSGDVSMLTWSGISFSNAVWEEHWAAIWVGKLPLRLCYSMFASAPFLLGKWASRISAQ